MSRNPRFDAVLERMRQIHNEKNSDYAEEGNPYSNFEGAAHIAGLTSDQGFLHLIGIKVERLRQLVSGKEPNFESLDDSILDLANYAALWLSYREGFKRPGDDESPEVSVPHRGEDKCRGEACPCRTGIISFNDTRSADRWYAEYVRERHPVMLGSVATGGPPRFIRCEDYPKCYYCGPARAEVTD